MFSAPVRLMGGLSASLAAFQTGPATAETVAPIVAVDRPAAVALTLRDLGYRAKLIRDDQDRPVILSGVGGYTFDITFFWCDGEDVCPGLLFSTWFDLDNGFDLEQINEWNRGQVVGRAFADADCDPHIDHYVSADPEMSLGAFEQMVVDWEFALTEFANFIGFQTGAPTATVASCGAGNSTI
ncbi:MAG: YbjN domain-containing protein [Pseudomonadota bacterium]